MEDGEAVLLVEFLGFGEAGFVNAVVEVGHHPGAYIVDLGSHAGRVEVSLALGASLREKVVAGGVEHTHDIFALVESTI